MGEKGIRVIAMGAILVIEDDHNLKGLIEKLLPQNELKFTGKPIDLSAGPTMDHADPGKGDPKLALEEIVREVLKAELGTGNEHHIHESVIGRVERALIGIILEEEHGNQVRAAKRLGINRNTLRKRMKDLHIVTKIVAG